MWDKTNVSIQRCDNEGETVEIGKEIHVFFWHLFQYFIVGVTHEFRK